ELGFWIEQAVRASDIHGAVWWELAKEFNEVVQLDFLSHCLADRCMELLLRSSPLEASLEKGLFEEVWRFAGFLLSQDVKAFLTFKKDPGPVLLKPFPMGDLVSTFVSFYSKDEMIMEPPPEAAEQISEVLPKVEAHEVAPELLLAPNTQSDLISSVPAIVDGPSEWPNRIRNNDLFLASDLFQVPFSLICGSLLIWFSGPRFFSWPRSENEGVSGCGCDLVTWTNREFAWIVFFFLCRAR
ncbi:hypothetical protein KI387_026744, partial [Taxus chinensis]